ncbi:D(2) dopamine receptor A-like [Amia ocellicauda]|uniref:D(2) dopamine receptor A-like n=1 Tax=Amia ocellicauda TaxID=2972642 RepID=UPI0034640039
MRANETDRWEQANCTKWCSGSAVSLAVAGGVLLLFTCLAGVSGNALVILAVSRQKCLQTSSNALLVNLALSDLLRCGIDCPLLLAISVCGYSGQDLGSAVCDAQAVCFSLSCHVQLLTIVSISAERYQAVARPFKGSQRKRRIQIWIPLTWAVAVLLSPLCLTLARDSPVYMKCRAMPTGVLASFDAFGLYVLVPVWFASLTVITGCYGRIFVLVKMHAKKIFDKGIGHPAPSVKQTQSVETQGKGPADGEKPQDTLTESTAAVPGVVSAAPLGEPPMLSAAEVHNTETVLPAISVTAHDISDQIPTPAISPTKPDSCATVPCPGRQPRDALSASDIPEAHLSAGAEARRPSAPVSAAPGPDLTGAVCMMPSFASKERARKSKESKLAKRSGYIIVTFLALWMPLVVSVLVNFFNYSNRRAMLWILEVETFSVAMVCMTSAINPITYAVVNPQFRSEFQQIKAKFISKMCSSS